MSNNPCGDKPPLTAEQIQAVLACVQLVIDSPDGCGEVTITVVKHIPRFIAPNPHLDLGKVSEQIRYLERIGE